MPSTEIQSAPYSPNLLTPRENFRNNNVIEAKLSLVFEALRLHGYCRFQVSGNSMLPAIWPGETVLIQSRAVEQLSSGDIVFYEMAGRVFLHRLREVRSESTGVQLITRGDAMQQADPPIPAERLLGVLASVRRNGVWVTPSRRRSTGSRIVAALAWRSDLFSRVLLRMPSRRNPVVLNKEHIGAS